MQKLTVTASPDTTLALQNVACFSLLNSTPKTTFVSISGKIYPALYLNAIKEDCVGLNATQRKTCKVSLGEKVSVTPWSQNKKDSLSVRPEAIPLLSRMTFEIYFLMKPSRSLMKLNVGKLCNQVKRMFLSHYFVLGQRVLVELEGINLELEISDWDFFNSFENQQQEEQGLLGNETLIDFQCFTEPSIYLDWEGNEQEQQKKQTTSTSLFKKGFDFSKLGVGGLDTEFQTIFRRAFTSRMYPPSFITKMGIQHVKGILLFGPPGTGKTMLARTIGEILSAKSIKVVNGPDLLNKFVGESEKNMRELFAPAENDLKTLGEERAGLHILIFDEMDALCRQRGSTNSSAGVGDTIVNQLLTKMDGVESLPNILIIGMTNRKDMIDEALLRPGRLEVHLEIGLPDGPGRVQILNIHTQKMREQGKLDPRVDLELLASQTPNFTGAELAGLCKAASSFALSRANPLTDKGQPAKILDLDAVCITPEDFDRAREDVKSAFATDLELASFLPLGYFPQLLSIPKKQLEILTEVITSSSVNQISVLIEGEQKGVGITALAVSHALKLGFPFTKVISSEQYAGLGELSKCNKILKCFEDALKTPQSCIVLDDLERLVEYVPLGQRFSNAVLQTLFICLKRTIPLTKKLVILATTKSIAVLEAMGLSEMFSAQVSVSALGFEEAIDFLRTEKNLYLENRIEIGSTFPLKKLLMACEMTRQGTISISQAFLSLL